MDIREQKLNDIISNGKNRVEQVLRDIEQEFYLRQDHVLKPEAMHFDLNVNGAVSLKMGTDTTTYDFTEFSRQQLLTKLGIPSRYLDRLLDLGENDLVLDSLDKLNKHQDQGYMIRSIKNKIKGVLSTSYRRMDCAPIFQEFVFQCLESGYIPYTGVNTEYRYNLSFILPQVFSPSENEFIVLGISITTSDYGAGALLIELLCLRITCLNLALGFDVMRNVHIGKRFHATDTLVTLSDTTHDLDNQTVASAVKDAVKGSLAMQSQLQDTIENSIHTECDIKSEIIKFKKSFGKDLAGQVESTYKSGLPIELLPAGGNNWRLSNAISLVANSGLTADIKLDVQKYAMSILV